MSTDRRKQTQHPPAWQRSAFVTAAMVGVTLLLASGLAYRAAADRYGRSREGVVLPPGTLSSFPLHFEQWRGDDVGLDESVIEATDTDDLINRYYRKRASTDQVAFYVAYGIQLRDLAPHRPEVCYPSAGWTMKNVEEIALKLPDETVLPCRIHRFERMGLHAESITVLSYYIVDGQYCPDVSLLRSRQWRVASDEPTYAAQIQISSTGDLAGADPAAAVTEFAVVSGLPIRSLLKDAVAEAVAAGE